jgi:thioredoxin reductase (NADPH)
MNEVIIIGSGPAGLTAAIYAARARLNPILFAGYTYGGQLMTTTEVENFPGFPDGIMGPELMGNMIKQAEKFGTVIKYENANKVEFTNEKKKVLADSGEYEAKSVIIATGATPKKLGIPGEDSFWAKGVSSCATCDGAFYRDLIVAVIGGGDSAVEEATFLTRFASKVYLIHRRDELRASRIMQERLKNDTKVEILFNTEVKEVVGDNFVTGLKIFNNKENLESELKVDGMFLAIGHTPITNYLNSQLELNAEGYIKSPDGVHTSVDGVFVAGDVEDYTYRQAITAAGAGCKAALSAEKWLMENN